jgi:hypothetical protein
MSVIANQITSPFPSNYFYTLKKAEQKRKNKKFRIKGPESGGEIYKF